DVGQMRVQREGEKSGGAVCRFLRQDDHLRKDFGAVTDPESFDRKLLQSLHQLLEDASGQRSGGARNSAAWECITVAIDFGDAAAGLGWGWGLRSPRW